MRYTTRSFISPLVAKGDLVSYGFPSSAGVGAEAPWNCDVHNAGTDGVVAFGIVNNDGNPGNIIVRWDGKDTTIGPGYYLRIYTVSSVPNCTHLITSGKVIFQTKGTYTIRLWGMHPEGETWYYDVEETLTVSVVLGDGEVKTKSIVLLTNHKLTVPIANTTNNITKTITISIDAEKTTITKITLDVDALSDRGSMEMNHIINGSDVGVISWGTNDAGKRVANSFDITGYFLLNKENDITFSYHLTWGIIISPASTWINAVLVIEYTGEEPNVVVKKEPWELEWWQWGIIGGVGILGTWVVLSSKGYAPSPTIIITQPYEYIKERLEERKR